jgi:hypothetical protein
LTWMVGRCFLKSVGAHHDFLPCRLLCSAADSGACSWRANLTLALDPQADDLT